MAVDASGRKRAASGRKTGDVSSTVDARLELVESGGGVRHVLDKPSLLVGRSPDGDIVLDESSVSARHARIDIDAAGVVITDLGSTNGTFLDGRRIIGTAELAAGQTLSLGRLQLRVERSMGGGEPAGDALGATPGRIPAVIPARRKLVVLASFDPADRMVGDRVVERLERVGHRVLVDRSHDGDGWSGRLLDAVWSCDAAVFVASAAAAGSERVHREVHLAAAERTPVLPVVIDDAELPDDLSFYLQRRAPVDLRRDVAAGLSELQRRLDEVSPKRVARPWRLARRIVAALVVGALLLGLYWFIF